MDQQVVLSPTTATGQLGSTLQGLEVAPCPQGPFLIYVPTREVLLNYAQLSRIVSSFGWRVFIDVSSNIWGAWYPPPNHLALFPMVTLPHPYIAESTHAQLLGMIEAFGLGVFNISYDPPTCFTGWVAHNDSAKPSIHVRGTGEEILTIRDLARALLANGWTKRSNREFVKIELSPTYSMNAIRIPTVRNVNQLSATDIDYIALFANSIFYLRPYARPTPNNQSPRVVGD